ncbi:hypothetical protein AAC387_Pa03g1708 [Persea americana]
MGGDLEPRPRLRRVGAQVILERAGAQWVALRWFCRGQAPSGPRWFWRGQAPSGWRPAFLRKAVRDLFNINDDGDDANARSDLTIQLELQNQDESTILE